MQNAFFTFETNQLEHGNTSRRLMVQNNMGVSCPNHLISLETWASQEEDSNEVMKDSKLPQSHELAKTISAGKRVNENKSLPKNPHKTVSKLNFQLKVLN